jgi:hypothetical protein
MEKFSCCDLHLDCIKEGRCVAERGFMASQKDKLEQACSLAKRLPLIKESTNANENEEMSKIQLILF